tara:strand:+ start:694 stop:1284 length:591 start_codon:yes stop_codon:yes gene_type:complete
MATWDDAGGAFQGAAAGATLPGPLAVPGAIIGGLVGFFGSQAKRRKQNREIDKHNKKIKKQRNLVKSQKKKVGAKTRGIATYFDTLEEYQTDIIDKETSTALDTFVENTAGQIETLEDVGAKTGLEMSSVDKKISTIKDLTSKKTEDIKSLGRQKEEALALQIAGERARTEASMRNTWADLEAQYDMLGEEYMDRV